MNFRSVYIFNWDFTWPSKPLAVVQDFILNKVNRIHKSQVYQSRKINPHTPHTHSPTYVIQKHKFTMRIWAKIPHPYTAKRTDPCSQVNQISWVTWVTVQRTFHPINFTQYMYFIYQSTAHTLSLMSITENGKFIKGHLVQITLNGNNHDGTFSALQIIQLRGVYLFQQ